MNQYRIVKRLLILLVLITVIASFICLVLVFAGKVSIDILPLFTSIVIFATIPLVIFNNLSRMKNNTIDALEYRVNARIIGKRKMPVTWSNSLGLQQDGSHFITFAFENGFIKELSVPDVIFNSFSEGQLGLLTFKENNSNAWFVSFQIYQQPQVNNTL